MTPARRPSAPLLAPVAALLLAVLGLAPASAAQESAPPVPAQQVPAQQVPAQQVPAQQVPAQQVPAPREPWPAEVIATAETLPIQDGGRIKPLHTFASFLLLRLNGERSVMLADGSRLEAVPWLLDTLFFPAQAADYPVFLVQDIQTVEAIGLHEAGKKKRDRYSFHELLPGMDRLFELAREYSGIEEKQRTLVQQQVLMLAHNVDDYAGVSQYADFARTPYAVGSGADLEAIFDGREQTTVSEVLARVPELAALDGVLEADPARATERAELTELMRSVDRETSVAAVLALYPPVAGEGAADTWHSPSALVGQIFSGRMVAPEHLAMLASFERAASSAARSGKVLPEFSAALQDFAVKSSALATLRGEYGKVGMEVGYYKAKLLTNGLVFFILAFVLAAVLWLVPRNRLLYVGTWVAVLIGIALLAGAIVWRCVIRGRPPVSTLYETLLFVTAVGTLAAVVMEWINRQRIALSAAAVLGTIGLFLANGYETLDKQDTMPSLVAVLDTNFWLATHVTAITIGYSAGMLAALLANVYLITRLFGRAGAAPAARQKTLSRMIYGVLCFGLIFSLVGTILGGIWANESWGRFWGWDPKENGALLICLTQLVILHGRMGGYLRDFGVALATGFLGTVIAFSWFGVNLLGVGLHSYGFTSGIHTALWSYYVAQWGLLAIAGAHFLLVALLVRARSEGAREAAQQAAEHAAAKSAGGRVQTPARHSPSGGAA